MNWIATGAFLMAFAVAMGAFGAHALQTRLGEYVETYHTAVLYHFLHAIGILLVAALARAGAITPALETRVSILFLAGILLFSGSLYLLALSGVRILGAITPFGGVAFLAGWLWLAVAALRIRS